MGKVGMKLHPILRKSRQFITAERGGEEKGIGRG